MEKFARKNAKKGKIGIKSQKAKEKKNKLAKENE